MINVDRPVPAPLAVVGMACRFPGADSVDAYWDLLTGNVDAITEVPADRFDVDAYYDPRPGVAGKIVSRFGGFLNAIREFDASFFGIAPREARTMDPQQRLLLSTAWEALEDAGIPPSRLRGSRGGVFVGQATADYAGLGGSSPPDIRGAAGGAVRAVTAGRLSYALDLRGPSLVIDTACSSSLVAVHLAKQSLRSGECDIAVAAGVNVVLSPNDAIAYSQGGMLAPDGRCKFADLAANGFVRSEGIAVVVLKRLPDAVAAGDPVRAVLLGSATSNDGHASGLLLQPAVDGQVGMLGAAFEDAGIDPAAVDYVEAHGTGTRVGDQVELTALGRALGPDRPAGKPCLVGSAKSNIGHCEAAAGLAGLIKSALVAEHRMVPASLHVQHPVDGASSGPLRVVSANQTLSPADRAPIVGVSAFGISGTNAHVVLTGYEPRRAPTVDRSSAPTPVLTLSARSVTALTAGAAAMHAHLTGPGARVAAVDVGHTSAIRRDHHQYRLAVTGESTAELAAGVASYVARRTDPRTASGDAGVGRPPATVFVFPGQGGQWVGMGRELYRTSPAFRAALDECDAAVHAEAGWSVVEVLHDDGADSDIDVVQPVLWAVEVAIAAHWASFGVTADAVIGHSMGEVAAAQVAGALSVRDAAQVICRRSAIMRSVAGTGSMLWTQLPASEAASMVADRPGMLSVAVDASPTTSVLSGDAHSIEAVAADLAQRGVGSRPVRVDVPSHSPLMAEPSRRLRDRLDGIAPRAAAISFHSTVHGRRLSGARLDADYWSDNLRLPVRFTEAMRALLAERDCVVVEIGPHPILLSAVREIQSEMGRDGVVVASMMRNESERLGVASAVAHLYAAGVEISWPAWYASHGGFTRLPSYRWDREEHWDEPAPVAPRPSERLAVGRAWIGSTIRRAGARMRGLVPSGPDRWVRQEGSTGRVKYLASESAKPELITHAAAVLGTTPERLDPRRRLSDFGLDSLMAQQLATRLRKETGVHVPVSSLLGADSIGALSDAVVADALSDLSA